MPFVHEFAPEATENVEHYRLNDREMLLTPDGVQFVWPTYNGPPQVMWMPPQVAVVFARKIVAFYEENFDA